MKPLINPDHPLYELFLLSVDESLKRHITSKGDAETAKYLAELLVAGVHRDSLFEVRNREGRPLESVSEMVAEGDVRQNADSFEREREVHQHIADFILFWSGVQPAFLQRLRSFEGTEVILDFRQQAKESYELVATYEEQKSAEQAKVFYKLRDGFDDYSFCLRDVRERLRIIPPQSA